MVATPQKYRNPRQGYYTDLGVDTTPIGAIVYNLKSGQNTFDHSYINDLSRHDRLNEVGGNAYLGGVDQPAKTQYKYLYCVPLGLFFYCLTSLSFASITNSIDSSSKIYTFIYFYHNILIGFIFI